MMRDINPATWLRPFQKTDTSYLIKMGLFYHALSLSLMYTWSFFSNVIISDYQAPQIQVSMLLSMSSGLLEESVFFGIPYYLTGNVLTLFGAGIIWSVAHLFNSWVFSFEALSYGGFLLSIPHIFFSIRTWISKKGWFAILFHALWNVLFLSLYCSFGWRQCSVINGTFDILNLVMAISAGAIVYLAYKNSQNQINRILYAIPTLSMVFAIIFLFEDMPF